MRLFMLVTALGMAVAVSCLPISSAYACLCDPYPGLLSMALVGVGVVALWRRPSSSCALGAASDDAPAVHLAHGTSRHFAREPMRRDGRPHAVHRLVRAVAALSFSVAVTAVPLATVSACSCAMSELPEAIRTADLAIVATSVAVESRGAGEIGERIATTWNVERSRDAIETSRISIESWADSGANCGMSFASEERWLVLAYAGDGGVLETNGCMQNRRLDGSDPEAEALITEALTEVPTGEPVQEAGIDVPIPIFVIGGAVVLLGAISFLAFRRSPVS
jgi:hypothetical protein